MSSISGISSNEIQNEEHIDLGRKFHYIQYENICLHLSNTYDFSRIQIFNINSIYWVPENDLLQCVSRMKNLHTLLALDTQLNLCDRHCEVYKELPLKKVAITLNFMKQNLIDVFAGCPQAEELCLKYRFPDVLNRSCLLHFYSSILTNYKNLKQLALIERQVDISKRPLSELEIIDYNNFFEQCPLICDRFIIKSDQDLTTVYELLKLNNVNEIVYNDMKGNFGQFNHFNEIICHKSTNPNNLEEAFGKLNITYFPRNGNQFGELYIPHLQQEQFGLSNRTQIISDILQTVPNLRKLTVHSCVLNHIKDIEEIGCYLENLRELEVNHCYDCSSHPNKRYDYHMIGKFVNLRKLSIKEGPGFNDSLGDILENLKNLESLRIVSLSNKSTQTEQTQTESNAGTAPEPTGTTKVLIENLKHAKKLKEFALYAKEIAFDPLFECFDTLNTKLERIYLRSKSKCAYKSKQMKPFIVKNPQLLLFINEVCYKNETDVISFEGKTQLRGCVTETKHIPNHIKRMHSDLVNWESYSGFDPFEDF